MMGCFKKIFAFFGIVQSVFLLSCSQQDFKWDNLPIKINVANEKQAKALNFYNSLFPGTIFFEISNEEDAIQVLPVSNSELLEDGAIGRTNIFLDKNGIIYSGEIKILEKFFYDEQSEVIMAHELMHLLGYMRHDKYGLMKQNAYFFLDLNDIFSDHLRQWLIDVYEIKQ